MTATVVSLGTKFDPSGGVPTGYTTLAAVPAGAQLFALIGFINGGNTAHITGVTGGSLTWTLDFRINDADAGVTISDGGATREFAIVRASTPAGLASGAVLTPTFNETPTWGWEMHLFYVTGLSSSPFLAGHGDNFPSSTSWNTGSVSPSVPALLLQGLITDGDYPATTITPAAGWTTISSINDAGNEWHSGTSYKEVAAGTYSGTGTFGGGQPGFGITSAIGAYALAADTGWSTTPTIVASTDQEDVTIPQGRATAVPWQRGAFEAAGRLWQFYADGGGTVGDPKLKFTTSADGGTTWATPTVIDSLDNTSTGGAAVGMAHTDVHFDGTHVHYVRGRRSSPGSPEYAHYRMGTPNSDGSITWAAAIQNLSDAASNIGSGYYMLECGISTDSNGLPWVANEINSGQAWLFKSDTGNGVWTPTTDGSVAPVIFSDGSFFIWTAIRRLNNSGAMIQYYWTDGGNSGFPSAPGFSFAQVWDGLWSGEEVLDDPNRGDGNGRTNAVGTYLSASEAYFAWADSSFFQTFFRVRDPSSGWLSSEIVLDGFDVAQLSMTVDQANGSISLVYQRADTPRKLYRVVRDPSLHTWSAPEVIADATATGDIASFSVQTSEQTVSGKFIVSYQISKSGNDSVALNRVGALGAGTGAATPANVSRSSSTSAAGTTTALRRKGVSRTLALTPSSLNTVVRSKGINRTRTFTSTGTTTTTHSVTFSGAPTDYALYFPLNEGSGTTATDASGNGRTGTLEGGSSWIAGQIGGGVRFDGASGSVISFPSLALATIHSAALWMRWQDAGDGIVIGGVFADYAFYFDNTNVYYSAGGGNFVTVAHGGLSGWQHWAVVRSDTSVSFYKNGSQVGSTQTLAQNNALTISRLGGYQDDARFTAQTDVDDIRFYTRALSSTEILALKNFTGGATAVNVNRSTSFTAAGTTTSARLVGRSRLTSLSPTASTTSVRSKGVARILALTPPGTSASIRSKGIARVNSFSPSGSSATLRQKGVSRALSLNPKGTTTATHTTGTITIFNVSRAINFTSVASSPSTRSKGFTRAQTFAPAATTPSVRLKGSPRAVFFENAASTVATHSKAVARPSVTTSVGTTATFRSILGAPFNINRFSSFTVPGATTTIRQKGISRANVQPTPSGATLSLRVVGRVRIVDFTVPGTSVAARLKGVQRSSVVAPIGDTSGLRLIARTHVSFVLAASDIQLVREKGIFRSSSTFSSITTPSTSTIHFGPITQFIGTGGRPGRIGYGAQAGSAGYGAQIGHIDNATTGRVE
jgi:hypothetical protein